MCVPKQMFAMVCGAALLWLVPCPLRAGPDDQSCPRVDVKPSTYRNSEEAYRDARNHILCLRQRLEEWGVVTMSAPIVMRVDSQFNFGPSKDIYLLPKDYINNAYTNVAGSSNQVSETSFSSQTSAQVSRTPSDASAAPAATPPPVPPLNVNVLTGTPVAPGSLPRTGLETAVKNPSSYAVSDGMNAKIREQIFASAVNPNYNQFPNADYDVYFAIVQISCNPGWRTRVNYIADISATCEYYDFDKQQIAPRNKNQQPLVFSVMPLLDAQAFELSNSDRRLTQLAAQVSASYPTIGISILGQELLTFVKRTQKDVVTRTPLTVSNSYTSGNTFGFRMAPSLTAQRDPAARRSGVANVLQSTSFPILVTMIVNRNDFKKQCYNSIITHVSHRWIISERPPLPQWTRRLTLPLKRESPDLRLDIAKEIADLHRILKNALPDGSTFPPADPDPALSTLRDEVLDLEAKCGGHDQFFRMFSKASNPKITGIGPLDRKGNPVTPLYDTTKKAINEQPSLPASGPITLVIHGENLQDATKVILNDRATTAQPIPHLGGQELIALFDKGDLPTDRDIPLVVVGHAGSFDSCFVRAKKAEEKKTSEESSETKGNKLQITVDRSKAGVTTLTADLDQLRRIPSDQILEGLTGVLRQAVAPQSTPAPISSPAKTSSTDDLPKP